MAHNVQDLFCYIFMLLRHEKGGWRMDLLQLHYFRTVARLEHVTRAAEELRVAQPALSKTIARLEAELAVPLFERLGRRGALNAFGRAFLPHVERIFMGMEDGRQ